MLAAALDPRTKALQGIPTFDQALVWELLEVEAVALAVLNEVPSDQFAPIIHIDTIPTEGSNDEEDFWDDIGGTEDPVSILHEEVNHIEFIRERVKVQIKEYRLLPAMPMKVDAPGGKKAFSNPLDWWRDNQHQFKLLASLARRILCIPSTSAPSERVFSTAGHTITKLRASLNSTNAAALVFLHDSWPVVAEYEAAKDKKRKR